MASFDEYDQDLSYARMYLNGYIEHDREGVPRKKFVEKGSAFENDCRRALARLFRSGRPLTREFMGCLADMFEPDKDPYRPYGSRELIAKNRSTHRPEDSHPTSHITKFVWDQYRAGSNVEMAVQKAMANFNLSREYVYRLWRRHKKIYEAVWGPVKGP
jgi:hypothetical protein